MQGRNNKAGTTALILHDFQLEPQRSKNKSKMKARKKEGAFTDLVQDLGNKYPEYALQVFNDSDSITASMLEKEFKALIKLSGEKSLTEDEKLILEKYKLTLMKTMQIHLLKAARPSLSEADNPRKKSSPFRYFVFAAFLLLEFVPMIWGSYLGITGLMSTLSWLPQTVITATGLLVCGIEAVLYYAVKGPLLKRALGIFTPQKVEPCLDIYEKQLQVLKNIDRVLLSHNKMDAAKYKQYAELAKLFSAQIRDLQTYALYVKTSFEDPELNRIEGKALIIVGDKVRFLHDKIFVKNNEGAYLTTTLTTKEKDNLHNYKCQDQTGKVLRIADNLKFLDHVINKTTSAAGLERKIKKFEESPFKRGLRWFLSAVDMSLNIGGGYFLATSLLAGTAATAALLATPLGWGIIGLIIIGQFALRLAVGSNAMFNLLNPGAEKHKKVTEEINEYELNSQKYDEIVTAKTQMEQKDAVEIAKTNPYVDSYKASYLNLNLYKNKKTLVEINTEQPPAIPAQLKTCRRV